LQLNLTQNSLPRRHCTMNSNRAHLTELCVVSALWTYT
jgi:hypothetical protein